MDTSNYIELIEKSNKNRRIIELPKSEYKTVYGENIQCIFFKGNFYSKHEYEEIQKQENNAVEKCITEIDKLIAQ
jgi:hypothetical protein